MRKWTAVLAALALGLGLAACGDDDDDGAASGETTATTAAGGGEPAECTGPADAYATEVGDPADFTPVADDTLTVVTSLPGPGFWEGSDDDPSALNGGFEYAIADAMREEFGLANLEVRNESFDAIVAGTVSDYDIALSQISITCERAEVVTFSMPYFESNQGVLMKAGGSMTTLEEAKAARWGVQTGTTALDLLETIGVEQEPSVYQQLPDAFTALEAGQVDAVLIDTAISLGQAARSDGSLEVVAQFEQPGGPDQYGAILPQDSDDVGAVNAVIQELKDSGELDRLATENLTADPGGIPVIEVE